MPFFYPLECLLYPGQQLRLAWYFRVAKVFQRPGLSNREYTRAYRIKVFVIREIVGIAGIVESSKLR
ncbi:hypothetical protein VTL71DRAFT_12007 [Oculimacula yallundae]|uniref:Uncharacterized protein n=1 Tax=Oculimacula yallundae TaxID=86028 RepID=A0ABR4CUB0_9HELO